MENTKMNLYESYLNSAKKYLVEDEEDLELTDVDTEEDTDTDAGEEDGAEEPVELDMANPVCPECGATLIPVGEIDTTEEDEDGNPLYDEDEANAIDLLQGRGYVIYKPVAEEEGEVDDDLAGEDDEDFGDEEDLDDEEIEDEE